MMSKDYPRYIILIFGTLVYSILIYSIVDKEKNDKQIFNAEVIEGVKLYSKPDINSNEVDFLPKGTKVKTEKETKYFIKINNTDKGKIEGYVLKDNLK